MATEPLTTDVRQQSGVAIIDLKGEIDGFSDEELANAYARAEQSNPPVVVLNFKDVDYINSTGIALIVGLLAKARQARRRLLVYGLSDHYQEIFSITRLSDFMSVYPDEESALSAVAEPV
ncbi:MAG: STAS domain-containing protein [Chloroflexota bacterium]|nr:STAS domain-containing protein [Chloroflexota bacterium]